MNEGPQQDLKRPPDARPAETVELDEHTRQALERVMEAQGLASLDQAAEWLLRRRLRRGISALTGRGRALHVVRKR